jgi:hypothetical protein
VLLQLGKESNKYTLEKLGRWAAGRDHEPALCQPMPESMNLFYKFLCDLRLSDISRTAMVLPYILHHHQKASIVGFSNVVATASHSCSRSCQFTD